jgi:hypothetical protein
MFAPRDILEKTKHFVGLSTCGSASGTFGIGISSCTMQSRPNVILYREWRGAKVITIVADVNFFSIAKWSW